jgi:hypothetical protein
VSARSQKPVLGFSKLLEAVGRGGCKAFPAKALGRQKHPSMFGFQGLNQFSYISCLIRKLQHFHVEGTMLERRPLQQSGGTMIWALVLFNLDGSDTEDTTERIRSTSLGNAKQLILGTSWEIQDEVLVDLAASSGKDLNVALAAFAEIPGVKSVAVVHLIQRS